jgi:hypothetical protein
MAAIAWGNFASRSACLGAGIWLAMALTQGLKPPVQWTPVKPHPVRVAVRVAAKPVAVKPAPTPTAAAVAPRQVLPLKVDKAPVTPKAPRPVSVPNVPVAATAPLNTPPVANTPVVPETPMAPQPPLPTLEQPAIVAPPQVAAMPLPSIPSSEVPPKPPEDPVKTYPEQPGGSVLVLELTVNDQGFVIDTRILVPSSNALGDVSLALASKGQRWTGLYPPLVPGEQRKLEIRVPYDEGKAKVDTNTLP